MFILNPALYRLNPIQRPQHHITRDNIDGLMDRGLIQVRMMRDRGPNEPRWWDIRRNGATKRWVKDQSRIRIPFKAGLYVYGAITEEDFIDVVPEAVQS